MTTSTTLYLNLNEVDSTVELPLTLHLKDKGIALVDITSDCSPRYKKKNLYLCCDFIEPSILQGDQTTNVYPILRMLTSKAAKNGKGDPIDKIREIYAKLIFVECNREEVTNIRMYVIDEDGNLPPFTSCQLKCTLLIIPRNG